MTQYTDYGSIPQAVRDLVANKISLLDEYILMQTGSAEYTALIRNPGKNVRQIVVSRASNYGVFNVSISDWIIGDYIFYCISNKW